MGDLCCDNNHQFALSIPMLSSKIRDFNKKVALFVTEKVGTMGCAYLFSLLALISLPEALASEDPLEIVSWIAQTFLQLVLLPIIIVGQNLQGEISAQQAVTDSDTLIAIHEMASEIRDLGIQHQRILRDLEGTPSNLA
jgi:hypothetical protein